MLKPIYVVPAPDALVRDPDRDYQPVPAEGCYVNPSPYWKRQISVGSVTVRKGPPPAAVSAPEQAPAVPKKTAKK